MLESVVSLQARYGPQLRAAGWFFTILFTVEYIVRLLVSPRPRDYALSFFGIVDLLAIFPMYTAFFVPGWRYFLIIRTLRLLRVFRVFQLAPFLDEANLLVGAVKASGRRIAVFLLIVITMVVILGASMYVIETAEAGFTSIPRSIYWAVVTLTTVGYGDISPQTPLGQAVAALIMILGYSLIIVPTGFVSVAATLARQNGESRSCSSCASAGHDPKAKYCKECGARMPESR
jgi:voltage-gated potassium channel